MTSTTRKRLAVTRRTKRCPKELGKLTVHPFADSFPMIQTDELKELAEDIKQHGQRKPILLASGMLIDGRNRRAACEMAGKKAEVVDLGDLTDQEIIDRIVSENVNRRHMTTRERTLAAVQLYDSMKDSKTPYTQEQVVKMFRVSRRSLNKARSARNGKPTPSKAKSKTKRPVKPKAPGYPKCLAKFVTLWKRLEHLDEDGLKAARDNLANWEGELQTIIDHAVSGEDDVLEADDQYSQAVS